LFERAPDRLALGTPASTGVFDAKHGALDRRARSLVEAITVREILGAFEQAVKLLRASSAA
jgi:hypothetical protein